MRWRRLVRFMSMVAATAAFAFPTLPMALPKLQALTKELEEAQFTYGLGAKIEPLSEQFSPGQGGEVDCSGYARWAIYHACDQMVVPDGSYVQHDWCNQQGFKVSSPDSCKAHDGVIRWCFLTPDDGGGVGHTLFVCNGTTYESHGGAGPDSRAFDPAIHAWMGKLHVYVIAVPA